MTRFNDRLADALEELAVLLRAAKRDRFRVRAYERAAEVVRASPIPLDELETGEITRLEGIGDAMARLITEYAGTGTMRLLDELRTAEPVGFGAFAGLPLIGLRDARLLSGTHGFADLASLRAAAAAPDGLDALGERLAARVREALRRRDLAVDHRIPFPYAQRDAAAMADALADVDGVARVEVAGAVRRCEDTVDGFALVVVAERPAEVAAAVGSSRAVVRVVEQHEHRVTVLAPSGRPTQLWLTAPDGAGAALLHATGDRSHLDALGGRAFDRALDLREDGLWRGDTRIAATTEAEIYDALGLPWIDPELRGERDLGGVDATRSLVEVAQLQGDLHVHTDWSGDGKATMDAMVTAASARGYAYVALTDHAENLTINGMSRDVVAARRRAIAELQERTQMRILDAAELNIGLDGSLDYDLAFLLDFDIGVASVHSHMDRPTAAQTDRILAAIAHPAVTVIGHPTGRILGRRPAYGIEITAIAQAAAETGTALEVNGSPRRLDLNGPMVAAALAAGAPISVASDAHSVPELGYVTNAVPMARRGAATAANVLNCSSLDELLAFTAAKRAASG